MAATATNSIDAQIEGFVQKTLNVTFLEEAFGCVIVHQSNIGATKVQNLTEQMTKVLSGLTVEQKGNAIRNYISLVAAEHKLDHLKWLFQVIIQLVNANVIAARMVCEQILSCDRLVYQNKNFWIESFQLIRKIINGVDYKGVREIMKGCRDKIQSFPYNINLSIMPQMKSVESVVEYIFDRNACLLPAYFIANEIQKSGPLHWKISQLTSSFVEDFRNIAQMVSIIGHVHMLPIVEHYGYTDSLINPWKLLKS